MYIDILSSSTVKNGMNVFTSGIALVGWWTLTLSGTGQWCWLDVELVVWCSRWWLYAGRKNIDIHQHLYAVFGRLHYLWFGCLMVWECVRIKCLKSCFIKYIYFLRLLFPWSVNICLYRHNALNAQGKRPKYYVYIKVVREWPKYYVYIKVVREWPKYYVYIKVVREWPNYYVYIKVIREWPKYYVCLLYLFSHFYCDTRNNWVILW
jgi:hypothetical protein